MWYSKRLLYFIFSECVLQIKALIMSFISWNMQQIKSKFRLWCFLTTQYGNKFHFHVQAMSLKVQLRKPHSNDMKL